MNLCVPAVREIGYDMRTFAQRGKLRYKISHFNDNLRLWMKSFSRKPLQTYFIVLVFITQFNVSRKKVLNFGKFLVLVDMVRKIVCKKGEKNRQNTASFQPDASRTIKETFSNYKGSCLHANN